MFHLKLLWLLILSFGITFLPTIYSVLPKERCRVSINKKEEFSEPQVLILQTNLNQTHPFKYPTSEQGDIFFEQGEEILLSCPGKDNIIKITINNSTLPGWENRREQIVSCTNNNEFEVENKTYNFSVFACKQKAVSSVIITGRKCAGDKIEIIIGFEVQNNFIPHIFICHDEHNSITLYTYFNLTPLNRGYQKNYPRPPFIKGQFYKNIPTSLDTLYAKNTQELTIGELLGDPNLGRLYINSTGDFFLSRGHFTATSDFVFGAQQRLTFFYINTAPQWQVFNSGNWKDLEESTRKFSSDRNMELKIYTGTYGICELLDKNGTSKPIYLYLEDIKKTTSKPLRKKFSKVSQKQKPKENRKTGIPVPKYYWKVLYNSKTEEGIAFIGVNNPYNFNNTADVFCEDVCDKINWVRNIGWIRTNVKLGYSFCCDVNEFRKTVKYLPEFNVKTLLE